MVGWSNYVLDAGKKLSSPTGGLQHATMHSCTENNPDKAFSKPGLEDPFQEPRQVNWMLKWFVCSFLICFTVKVQLSLIE